MAYFKNDRFKKPSFNQGRDRGNDRGGFRNDGAPKQMYEAKCSNCGDGCQVPFRPDGIKPVFCRNCFSQGMGREPGPRTPTHGAPRRDFGPRQNGPSRDSFAPRASAAAPDRRIDALQRSLQVVEEKLDRLTALLRDAESSPKKAPMTSAAKSAKAPAKKVKKTKKK